ncbi:MAG: hypothetical protein ACM3TR_15015 [Caulobacteraceae bacterium]
MILTLGFIFQSTSAFGLPGRIIVAALIVLLQGFFMGMPFPRGLKLIGENGKGDTIPVMWGVNGVTSVIGSVLSIILSMSIGFTGALIAGAAVYLIVSHEHQNDNGNGNGNSGSRMAVILVVLILGGLALYFLR